MYELYTWVTPNGWKASIALEELNVPYEVIPMELSSNVQKSEEFLAINPNGRIPALVDKSNKDFPVFESGAILMYLAEKHQQLLPESPLQRSKVIQWLMFQMGGLGPIQGQTHAFLNFMDKDVPQAISRFQSETRRLYGVLDKQLQHKEFIVDEYSIADIAVFPWVYLAHWAEIELQEFPALHDWFTHMSQRPAVQRGLNQPHATEFWKIPLRQKKTEQKS